MLVALAVLALGVPIPLSTPAAADSVVVDTFADGSDDVTLSFKEAATNSSALAELPKGCTVLSATVDVAGEQRRGDDVRSLDFFNYDPGSVDHRSWQGTVQGNYPPTSPFWNPYSPRGTELGLQGYDDVGTSDDARLTSETGTSATNRYPFHLFRFGLPPGTLTALSVEWEGFGYCLANATTRGAEMFLWRNGSRSWEQVDWYSRTEAAQDRLLEASWSTGFDKYVDDDLQVFVLVYGKRSERVAGPNPWTAEGELHTDYVRLNATLAGAWEQVFSASLSIEPWGEVWSMLGPFQGRVTVSTGLDSALQAAVDAQPVEPGNLTVPMVVNVSATTAGVVRLSNLSVTYDPIVNAPPWWGAMPELDMVEDVDAERLLDLATVAFDDHSQGRLVYTVVYASTTGVEAIVEEGHYLSFYVREANWWGRAIFRLNATDPWGLGNTSSDLAVVVGEVNDPPKVTAPGRQYATEEVTFHYQVMAGDVDDSALYFSVDPDFIPIDASTGEINFTPTNDHVGLHHVNVTVTDARGAATTVGMELQIDNANDPPVIHDPGPLSGTQGVDLVMTWTAEDPDLQHGDVLMWQVLGSAYYVSNVQLNPLTGEMEWRNIGNGDVGAHTFTVQVVDSGGAEDRVDVNLTIANVNDPPSFLVVPDLQVSEDGHLGHNVHVVDLDLAVDPEEELSWTVEPALFDVSPDGVFSFVPAREHVGVHTVLITVTDRAGESYSQTFKITVKHVNHPPVIMAIGDQTVHEDVPWTIELVVTDPDSGDVVEVTSRGAPFRVPSQGGNITWTPEQRHGGDHLVTIEATDALGAKAVMAFNLTVVVFNDPPWAAIQMPTQGEVFDHDEELDLFALAQDEEGAHLVIVWKWRYNDRPDQEWTRINTGSSVFWPNPPDGTILIRVEVSDDNATTVDEVVITVRAPPDEDKGGSGPIWVALAIIVVAALLFLVMRGRRAGPAEETAEGKEPAEWKVWNEDGTPWLPDED